MTATAENTESGTVESLLPPAPVDVRDLRVTRAQLAKFLGCSKQTTGEWARKGIVTFSPADDRANLGEAIRQVVERADPKRLRIRAFRDLVRDHDMLRCRIRELEAKLACVKSDQADQMQALQFRINDRLAVQLMDLQRALVSQFDQLRVAHSRGGLFDAIESLVDAIFYPDGGDTCPESAENSGQTRDAESRAPPSCPECPECPE
jgi:hypothetical protein